MKILIIDDERSIRNSLKEILADEGYEVEVAENGVQGCEMADKEKYNVIFCDIKMPEMDGMEVLNRLNTMGVDAAVVMISGHADIQTAVECIKKGAFDFIQKPLDLNRIKKKNPAHFLIECHSARNTVLQHLNLHVQNTWSLVLFCFVF